MRPSGAWTLTLLGMDGHGPREQTAVGHRCRYAYLRDGPAGGASGRPGRGAGLCASVFDRWSQGLRHGAPTPLWLLGSTAASPSQRPLAQTPLDALAGVALCAGGQVLPALARGRGEAPRGVRHHGTGAVILDLPTSSRSIDPHAWCDGPLRGPWPPSNRGGSP